MHIVLFTPEIPPNTGNIARLCAATDTALHLVEPLGFSLADRYLKRAGLDYWPYVRLQIWPNFDAYARGPGAKKRWIMTSARRGTPLQHFQFTAEDSLIFGPESTGLPPEMLRRSPWCVRIPLRTVVRSLNLSTAAGIVLYTALFSSGVLEEAPWS